MKRVVPDRYLGMKEARSGLFMKNENEYIYLREWILAVAKAIDDDTEPDLSIKISFTSSPDLALQLVDILAYLEESDLSTHNAFYSSCIYALDTCVMQLRSAEENGNK